jgi:hypothetical protein
MGKNRGNTESNSSLGGIALAIMNEDGQWIILIGFIVSVSLLFLGIVANESTLVGQTTAESVLEFSKSDIQDIRDEVARYEQMGDTEGADFDTLRTDIETLSLKRKGAVLSIVPIGSSRVLIHYNNGVTSYNETASYPRY